jgi:hypothetical protein
VLDLARGQAQFVEKCQQCHAPNGIGGYGPALTNTVTCPACSEFTQLWKRIDEFMPFRNPEACDAACSRDIAAWINNGFSTAASCAVRFRYDSVAGQRFAATVQIDNFSMRGLTVPSWRLGFTLPPDHRVTAASNAVAEQSGDQVLLKPIAATPSIPSGAVLEIRLEGSHGGAAALPADLRLEAPPCFTAVSG